MDYRVITTIDELNALPHGAVLRTASEGICEVDASCEPGQPRNFWYTGSDDSAVTADEIALPAQVLWVPGT